MREVVYHPRVPSEVRETYTYYTNISQHLGESFWEEFAGAIHYAREFPERHHFDPSGFRRSNLKRFPYHFLFQIFPRHIRIIVVRHNRRHPGFGIRRI